MMADCTKCHSALEEGQIFCPACGKKAQDVVSRPEPTLAVILLASLGGLIAFFGLFFGIVGAVAEGGFIYVSLVACSLAIIMIAIAYFSRRRQLHDWRQERQLDASLANCAYCGYHNEVGSRKCESCGAPLKLRR